MEKINFQNLPNTTTPLNATNMNLLQTNVENAIKDAGVVVSATEPTTDRKKVWLQFSDNMYDGTIDKTGYILNADGTETTNEGCFITSYVKVMPNTTYELTYNSTYAQSGMRIGEYTSNKTFIQRLVTSETTYIFTTTSTTEYVKFSAFISYASNISIIGEYKEQILNNNVYEKFTETIGVGTQVDRKRKVNFIHSRNILNPSLYINNSYANITSGGTEETPTNNNYWRTGKQRCLPNTIYYFNVNSINYVCYYQKDGTPISVEYNVTTKFITPANCYYVQMSFAKSSVAWESNVIASIESGIPYEPYVTPSISVDGEKIYNDYNEYDIGDIFEGGFKGGALIEGDSANILYFNLPLNKELADDVGNNSIATLTDVYKYTSSGRTEITSNISAVSVYRIGQTMRIRINCSNSQGTAWSYCGLSCNFKVIFA